MSILILIMYFSISRNVRIPHYGKVRHLGVQDNANNQPKSTLPQRPGAELVSWQWNKQGVAAATPFLAVAADEAEGEGIMVCGYTET